MIDILQKSDVESSTQDQAQQDSTSEGKKKNELITSDAEQHLFPVLFNRSYLYESNITKSRLISFISSKFKS